jgi:hypothetical protein
MISEGGVEAQRQVVADVATTLFGVPVDKANVIGETLQRITDPGSVSAETLRQRIADPVRQQTSTPSPATPRPPPPR